MSDNIELNKTLIDKYPFLLPRNAGTNKPIEDYDYSYNLLEASIPDGGWKTFGIAGCEDLAQICIGTNIDLNTIFIQQAKEKYGGLRVYLSGYPKEWSSHEAAGEYISQHTCGRCGKFPSLLRDDGGVYPWCDSCFQLQHPDWDKERMDRFTIHDYDNERLVEYIRQHIYSKEEDTTIYIDLKPYYLKIGYDPEKLNLIRLEELEDIGKEKDAESHSFNS